MITAEVFSAFLKCPTKAYLTYRNTRELTPEFADWIRRRTDELKSRYAAQWQEKYPNSKFFSRTPFAQIINDSDWYIAFDCLVQGHDAQSIIHVVEHSRSLDKGGQDSFIPVRCVPDERVGKNDRLLLAFDAYCLAAQCRCTPSFGKIVYGNGLKVTKVQLSGLLEKVRDLLSVIANQQSTYPPLILNRHCPECGFQPHCRELAIEKDDLSLLSSLSTEERQAYHNKGIFTVTQLSYTFRPRRRPKRLATQPEPYHHALRALAIREQKIHVAGKPELKTSGTPVYLDIEGTGDFYYLIGARIADGKAPKHVSFWADEPADEARIWAEFKRLLAQYNSPQLIHYGSYETTFLKRMKQRYEMSAGSEEQSIDLLLANSLNILSVTYGRIYFPTYSNGLKDVATHLGYRWTDANASGARAVLWRNEWEATKRDDLKHNLLVYNAEDCAALEIVTSTVALVCQQASGPASPGESNIVDATSVGRESFAIFGRHDFALPELKDISKAAYWDYQRERITIRNGIKKRAASRKIYATPVALLPVNKVIFCVARTHCPDCGSTQLIKTTRQSKIVYDLKFSRHGVKRWIVKYVFARYRCSDCGSTFCSEEKQWTRHKFGTELLAYIIYHVIELKLHQGAIAQHLRDICGCTLRPSNIKQQKARAAAYYAETYDAILRRILSSNVIHADETKVNVKGIHGYAWILTSIEDVFYFHTETREGERIQELLRDYKGVLVSDFYAVYDAIACPQQKCLIHLMRDLNDALLKEPYNVEMKKLVQEFAGLLKPAVETIDRFGLKSRHLHKHKKYVVRFFGMLDKWDLRTEAAAKFKQRFDKNRDKLFTFLDYDGVSWNNNNAEHAVKAFAAIRDMVRGSSTKRGLDEYLILLSVCQSCIYKEVSFLDFLRSGSTDVQEFANGRRSYRR